MTSAELQKIIDQFDEDALKKKGIFGIFQYGSGPEESLIRANKEGLKLYALELLKSSQHIDKVLAEKGKNVVPLEYEADWVDKDSNTLLQYVEPVAEERENIPKEVHKETIGDKLLPYGCILAMIILAAVSIIGIWTIIKWLL